MDQIEDNIAGKIALNQEQTYENIKIGCKYEVYNID